VLRLLWTLFLGKLAKSVLGWLLRIFR